MSASGACTSRCRTPSSRGGRQSGRVRRSILARGYNKLYVDHVLQANKGADLDFLVGKSGAAVPKDNH